MPRARISLVMTVFNEGDSIDTLFDSIMRQTIPPDEIVVVDAGSTDGTVDIIETYRAKLRGLRIIVEPGCDRGHGRNVGIQACSGEIVLVTDAGCELSPRFVELLSKPFESGFEGLVGGLYETNNDLPGRVLAFTMNIWPWTVAGRQFLPSSRCVAFPKKLWSSVGGYPEHLDTAEDTLFDLRCLRCLRTGAGIITVDLPLVRWNGPRSLWGMVRQVYRYNRGDGRMNLRQMLFFRVSGVYVLIGLLPGIMAMTDVLSFEVAIIPLITYLGVFVFRRRQAIGRVGLTATFVSTLMKVLIDVVGLVGYGVGALARFLAAKSHRSTAMLRC